jgi:glutamyl-tRNA synthetase
MPNNTDSQIPPRIITRFAPSPTGFLHAGAYRTAIFSYLYARKHNGTFVLRIEDTDRERSKKEYEENILESLAWLGLESDVFVRQSENVLRHKAILESLIAEGKSYVSKEAAKDGSGVIREIVRFKNPNSDVTFLDEIKGEVTMNTADLGDFVIAKNINEPLFNFAVVVDDFDAGVTHVIRGEDHVSNTPRQILIQRAIGAPTPSYAHLPLVLGSDKQKLSKRRGALALTEYRDQGYLPEALLNMVTMVGWNPGTEQELFSKEELIHAFDFKKVQKSPAVFNLEKLDWFNKEYIKQLHEDARLSYVERFLPEDIKQLPGYSSQKLAFITPLIVERIMKFGEVTTMAEAGELSYYFSAPTYDKEKLFWKGESDHLKLIERLTEIKVLLSAQSENDFTRDTIKAAIWDYAEKEGRGQVLWPFRVALSGKDKSPDPIQLSEILGKTETITRLTHAISLCHEQ